ncbi:MAG: glycosyltransferase family A protein [Candidatus Taylorbacteria bacterium]
MNSPLKVSLCIPAYNEEKIIAECLKYVKESGGDFFEILVINNASTDRTAEIAASIPGVRVVYEEKKGLVMARQRAYLEAKGDVLAFVDADTRMPRGWYEKIVAEFTHNPKTVCLSGPYVYYDCPTWHRLLTSWSWTYIAFPVHKLITGFLAVGGNFVISKKCLDQMNGFDTTIAFYSEDTDIARRASKFGKVVFDLSFKMPSSGRRMVGQGFFKTGWLYYINFLSAALLKRPTTQKYIDIR